MLCGIACCIVLHPLVAADSVPGTAGTIEITPLIHSSVQLEYGGTVIQIDPWDRVGLPGAKPADLILITDDVGHHLDTTAITKLRKSGAPLVMPANGSDQIEEGIVLANGETIEIAGVTVEAVAAYDIIPGEPSHPKGEANGYVVTLGGARFFFAGVTECVAEVQALRGIDVAFLPMNVPLGRMTPAATAECARTIQPRVLYPYHYDQDYARRAPPAATPCWAPTTRPAWPRSWPRSPTWPRTPSSPARR
jgi:L-ascorbate metabolism protein UlaG (beta-lactamase superfamily)